MGGPERKRPRSLTVAIALGRGYSIVSRAHCIASRIDRKDWREVQKDSNLPVCADWYRRCVSKDWITVPQSWLKLLPNSLNGPKEFLP